RPLQRIRLATEAAGAAGVVDRSSPSEHEGASHRSTHGFRQDYPMRTPLRLWQFHQGGAGSFVPYLYIYVCAPTRRGGWLGRASCPGAGTRSEEHTSELQSRGHLVCRLLLEKKKKH